MDDYPIGPLNRLRDAILADDKKAGAEAAIELIGGFLSDVRRIADGAQHVGYNTEVLTNEYIQRR